MIFLLQLDSKQSLPFKPQTPEILAGHESLRYACVRLLTASVVHVCRAAGSPAEEAQEDLHRENGEDSQPVEEHRCAVCQLVSSARALLLLRSLAVKT